jgi:hypothetical protein
MEKLDELTEARISPIDYSLTDELEAIEKRPIGSERVMEIEEEFGRLSDLMHVRFHKALNTNLSKKSCETLERGMADCLLRFESADRLLQEYFDFFKGRDKKRAEEIAHYSHPNFRKFVNYCGLIADIYDNALGKKQRDSRKNPDFNPDAS